MHIETNNWVVNKGAKLRNKLERIHQSFYVLQTIDSIQSQRKGSKLKSTFRPLGLRVFKKIQTASLFNNEG